MQQRISKSNVAAQRNIGRSAAVSLRLAHSGRARHARLHSAIGNQAMLQMMRSSVALPGRWRSESGMLGGLWRQIKAAAVGATGLVQRTCACDGNHDREEKCSECKKSEPEIRPKLIINQPGDRFEREADQMADAVTGGSMAGRASGGSQAVQLKGSDSGIGGSDAPNSVHAALASPGQSLDPSVRSSMEQGFGANFGSVRIHTDRLAANSASDIAARAYTVGTHVVFGAGQYSPASGEGQKLIAHELTHVMQQAGAHHVRRVQREPLGGPNSRTNFTPEQSKLLQQARRNINPKNGAIVGVLIPDSGPNIELVSGGGQGFSSHIEGKATAKMVELGIKNATLLVEKEPCQICDRSTYPSELGPEAPLRSSRTGKEISRQTPKINSALPTGSRLWVVGPESTGGYDGIAPARATPRSGTGSRSTPSLPKAVENGAKAIDPPAEFRPVVPPERASTADTASEAKSAPPSSRAPAGAPRVPSVPPGESKLSPGEAISPGAPAPSVKTPNAGATERRRSTSSNEVPREIITIPSEAPPPSLGPSAKGEAIGGAIILGLDALHFLLEHLASSKQHDKLDAEWKRIWPSIQAEISKTGKGIVVYVEFSRYGESEVLNFESFHWDSSGADPGPPGSIRPAGQSAVFQRVRIEPTRQQASATSSTAVAFRLSELDKTERLYQQAVERMSREGFIGRYLLERAGKQISPQLAYEARAHIASARIALKQNRLEAASQSLDLAEKALDALFEQIEDYRGRGKPY